MILLPAVTMATILEPESAYEAGSARGAFTAS